MMKMQEQPSVVVKTGLPFFDVQCSELVQAIDLLDLSPLHSIASDVFVSRFHVLLDAIENFFRYAKGQTSVPGVFAAGDCTTVPYKQIVIAAGRARRRR